MDKDPKDPLILGSWKNVHNFSKSLLDLLWNTYTNRKRFLQLIKENPQLGSEFVDSNTMIKPITLLATRLLSSATALFKECNLSEEFWQNLNSRNIKIMSRFSSNDKSSDAKQLDDIRILILRVLLAVCHTCQNESLNLEEVFQSGYVSNLEDTIKGIFNQYPDVVTKDMTLTTSLEISGDDPSLKAMGDDCDHLLIRESFIFETLLKIFDSIGCAVDSTSADVHELKRLVNLLQEFQHNGGYHILMTCVRSLVHKVAFKGRAMNEDGMSKVENASSMNDDNTLTGLDLRISRVEEKLMPVFKAFGNLCKLVKQLKSSYLHGIKCRKRYHHHCDLSNLPHQHHDILGIALSRYENNEARRSLTLFKSKDDQKQSTDGVFQGAESSKKQSKRMKKAVEGTETPSSCVIGTAVNFLMCDIFPISPSCVGFVTSALDAIGICHCVQPCTFVVPMLSSLRYLPSARQDMVLATVGLALLQMMDTSHHVPEDISNRDKNETPDRPSYELPSDYPTLTIPWQQGCSYHITSAGMSDNDSTREIFTKPDITAERFPNIANILDKTNLPRWICLACYKVLLQDGLDQKMNELGFQSGPCAEVTLALKGSKHLASVAAHFDEESLCVLLTTVILPVLQLASDELSDDEFTSRMKIEYEDDDFKGNPPPLLNVEPFVSIIINMLEILFVGLSEKEEFRNVFIRHSGIQLLLNLLLPYLCHCNTVTEKGANYKEKIFDSTSACLEILIRNAKHLRSAVKIMILPKPLADNAAENISKRYVGNEDSDHNESLTLFGRIVKGIRKSPKVQQRDSSRPTFNPVNLIDETIDERALFHSHCERFLCVVMQGIRKIMDVDATSIKNECEVENIADMEAIDEFGGASSKSSGYQSKSRKSSSAASNAIGVHLLHATENKSTSLPDYDAYQMEKLYKICRLVSTVVQDSDVVLNEFCDMEGLNEFLQVLMSTVASLDPAKSNCGGVQDHSETSLENHSYEILNDHSSELHHEADTSQLLDNADVKSTSSHESGDSTEIGASKSAHDEREVEMDHLGEIQEDINNMQCLKFKILSCTLSICLLYTKNNCDSLVSTEDIVSMVKSPLRQNHLMCTHFCKLLCKALFEASVKERHPKMKIHPNKKTSRQKRSSSPIRDEAAEINLSASNYQEDPSDGYQGDTESDMHENTEFSIFGRNLENESKLLLEGGLVINPELIELVIQLLGDARRVLQSFGNSEESSPLHISAPLLSTKEFLENLQCAVHTTASLVQYSRRNFEMILSNSDIPLAFMSSFSEILRNDCKEEDDIRQSILELCLMFNMELMSAEHFGLVLSFFNSEHPPMEQLLTYLLVLVNNLYAGPGDCLQFPVEGNPVDCPPNSRQYNQNQQSEEAYTLSVWKIAPLRLPINGNVRWPTSNVGLTISLWLQVGSFGYFNKRKSDKWGSYWDFHHTDTAADGDRERHSQSQGSVDFDPYHHLVSIGTKQSMLQIWLEGGTLIFRICVDAPDGKPVGVLAQRECPGLVAVNGEWQHITFTYTENQLPDKTILGKVHAIVNCTNECDIILERTVPHNGRGTTSRKNADCLTLFVGHWIRPVQTKLCLQNSPGYQLGTVMLFDGIHFTMRSAFAIYRQGPDISNLTENLETADAGTSSAPVSSKVCFSQSMNFTASPMGSPASPTCSFGFGSYKQFFPLPYSFLVSDLASEEFFTDRTLPNSISLQEHLVLSYCPTDPTIYLCNPAFTKPVEPKKRSRSFTFFSSSTPSDASNQAEKFDPLNFQSMQMQVEQLVSIDASHNMGLQRSLSQIGGIQVLLMLCAKVIEITSDGLGPRTTQTERRQAAHIQSCALRALLDLRRADTKRHEEFYSQNIAAMLHKLLTKPQALVGFDALHIIFNATCSGDDVIISYGEKFQDEDDHFEINEENSALLYDHELIQVFLIDWQIWHKAVNLNDPAGPPDNFLVWSLLLDGILNLVGADHPHQWHNCNLLMQIGIVEKVLKGLQKMIFHDIRPFPSRIVTSKIIELLRILVGSPPDVSILGKICDFLVAIHPPASTYVCHTFSSFYFNLRSSKAGLSHMFTLTNNSMQSQLDAESSDVHSVEQLPMQMQTVAEIEPDVPTDIQNELFQEDVGNELSSSSKDIFPKSANSKRGEENDRVSGKEESGADSSWDDIPHVVQSPVTTPISSKATHDSPDNTVLSPCASETCVMPSFHSVDDGPMSESEEEISYVISELLGLLFVAMRIMPDMDAFELTTGPLCARCLIIGIHHQSSDVRAATIKLLAAYLSRCSKKIRDDFLQEKGFHLVANQIHEHIAPRSVVDSCLYFLFGHPTSSVEPFCFDQPGNDAGMLTAPDTFSNHAVILLLATLTQTTHDARLCEDVVARLQELFESVGPAADVMLDNGLTLALCNLLLEILGPSCELDKDEKRGVLKEIQHFMTCIAIKACTTAGSAHFQVSEDLFTLLHKVKNEFVHSPNEQSMEASAQIQTITFDILMLVMGAMEKNSNGKSLLIQKNAQCLDTIPSQIDRSPYASKETVRTPTHSRSASGDISARYQKTAMNRRSISSASGLPGSSESFRSHRGNLRTRSYRGSQRRRINEAETARRLQRLIIIAVDNIVYQCDWDSSKERDQVESGILESDNFLADHVTVETLFNMLVDWIESTLVVTSTWHGGRRGSRYGNMSNANDFVKVWKRILNISRDSIVDQFLRLVIYLMSPWQRNQHIKYLPILISQRSTAERIMLILFPKDSKFLKKISVYLDDVIVKYKHEMNSAEKKALKDFCKIFQKCGGVVYRTSFEFEVTNEIEKLQVQMDVENNRELRIWNEKNRDAYDQLRLRTDHLSSAVTQRAMDITQKVVLRQNIERKKMAAYEKEEISNDICVRNQWSCLLEQLAHERAVFYDEKRYPKSWQLDATEGPYRERRRMQRCHLNIADRFFLRKSKDHDNHETERRFVLEEKMRRMVSGEDSPVHQETEGENLEMKVKLQDKRPLSFLFDDEYQSSDSNIIRARLQTNEKISMVQNCTNVTASSETPGELMIGETSMYFVGDEKISDLSLTQALFGECEVLLLSWRHEEVMEIHNRWWQLQDTAIEMFLTNGKTYFLAFRTQTERDMMVKRLSDLNLPTLVPSDNNLEAMTQLWQSGKMTNFDYLTQLNKSAGRSFNDLMQYPVMPFILADYTSAILDFNNVETFRNLVRPISVPDDARMKHYKDRYKNLADDYKNCPQDERELGTQPCHYGSHYSNSGTVLHFLVRLPPYTQMFLDYQDSSFDIPDRTFHSMETTFRLSCYSSTTDVKELIPEFFFLPEFLCNLEGFDLGIRQCGLRVNHVTLPPWSKMDPRLFILIHRQALESDYVSANLHGWIDLVFGYKQTGKAAIEAVNVFHPATYFGVDVNSVEDPVARKALKTMIKTYGQTPKQLFAHPHPPKKLSTKNKATDGKVTEEPHRSSSEASTGRAGVSNLRSVQDTQTTSSSHEIVSHTQAQLPQRPLPTVLGLKWGTYLGSPCAPEPVPFLIKTLTGDVGSLVPLRTNDVCVLSSNMALLVMYNHGHRGKASQDVDAKWSAVLTYGYPDNIIRLMTKKSLPDINLIRTPSYDKVTCSVIGSGCQVIVLGHSSGAVVATKCNAMYDESHDLEIRTGRTLYGHYAAITCLVCCGEFRILASGSKDGTAILWDLDALTYIRSLTGHATAVSCMAISKTSGDICTVCDSGNDDGSHIRLWTINGSLVAAQDTRDRVNCVTFSSAAEGISVNLIAAGMSNGVIRLWSSWDLMWIRDIVIDEMQSSVTSLTYTQDGEVIYAASSDGKVVGLCYKGKVEDKHPLLISFLNIDGARVQR